jgi:hypothetical protein
MAIEAGAKLANMQNAFWMQSVLEMKPQHRAAKPNYLLGSDERARPGAILVNRRGRRFVNEAANYNALGNRCMPSMLARTPMPICRTGSSSTSANKTKYHAFNSLPGAPAPSFMMQADTLEDLAERAGIDPQGLGAEVAHFNDMVRRGQTTISIAATPPTTTSTCGAIPTSIRLTARLA